MDSLDSLDFPDTLCYWFAVIIRRDHIANLCHPDVNKNLGGEGMAIVGGSTEQFSKRIRNDHTRWVKLVREARLKGE